jgi:hypothetical protein
MRRIRLLVVLGVVGAVLAAPFAVFFARSPALVVTEAPFVALYGEARLKKERTSAAYALFRQVKPVLVADGVSPDMVIFAITEASRRPACVLFPRSQAQAALRFHEQFPEIPAVVLRGLVTTPELPPSDGFLCIYDTDREVDLYRAGLFAGILGVAGRKPAQQTEKQADKQAENQPETPAQPANIAQTYVFWQDRFMPEGGRELFSQGVREQDPESNAIFINVATQVPDIKGIACVTLTGAGAEYLERNAPVPQILFGWLDPAVLPREVVVQFDDSVWALAAPAARMAMQRQAEGKIPSKPLIFSRKVADNSVFRMLEKSAKKVP